MWVDNYRLIREVVEAKRSNHNGEDLKMQMNEMEIDTVGKREREKGERKKKSIGTASQFNAILLWGNGSIPLPAISLQIL